MPGESGELVAAGHREALTHVQLLLGQHADAEGAGGRDLGPALRGTRGRQRDQRRIERERGEALTGESYRSFRAHRGRHDHSGGEAAQCPAELVAINRSLGPEAQVLAGHPVGMDEQPSVRRRPAHLTGHAQHVGEARLPAGADPVTAEPPEGLGVDQRRAVGGHHADPVALQGVERGLAGIRTGDDLQPGQIVGILKRH